MYIYLAVVYIVMSAIAMTACLTDQQPEHERLHWYETLAITFLWPILLPVAAISKIYDDIGLIRNRRRMERRQHMTHFIYVVRRLELVNQHTYTQAVYPYMRLHNRP